jgi:hypothetical protein
MLRGAFTVLVIWPNEAPAEALLLGGARLTMLKAFRKSLRNSKGLPSVTAKSLEIATSIPSTGKADLRQFHYARGD